MLNHSKKFIIIISLIFTYCVQAMAPEVPAVLDAAFLGCPQRITPFNLGRVVKDFVQCLLTQDRLAHLLMKSTENDSMLFFLRNKEIEAMRALINSALLQEITDDARKWLKFTREKIELDNQKCMLSSTGELSLMHCIFTVSPYATAAVLAHGDIFQRYIDRGLAYNDGKIIAEFLSSENEELKGIGNCLLSSLQKKKHGRRSELLSDLLSNLFGDPLLKCALPYVSYPRTRPFLSLVQNYTKFSLDNAEKIKKSLTVAQFQEIEMQGSKDIEVFYSGYLKQRELCEKIYCLALTKLKNICKQCSDVVHGKSPASLLRDGDNELFPDMLDGQQYMAKKVEEFEKQLLQEKERELKQSKQVAATPEKKIDKKSSCPQVTKQQPEISECCTTQVTHEPELFDTNEISDKNVVPAHKMDKESACDDNLSWIRPFQNQTSIAEETPTLTRINDCDNDMELFLYSNQAQERVHVASPLCYTDNVQQWFDDAAGALVNQKYCGPKARVENTRSAHTYQTRWYAVRIHRFSKLVDAYLNRYGIAKLIPDRFTIGATLQCVVIPGAVRYNVLAGHKRIEPCCFAYLFNARGECFHRLIERRDQRTFIADVLGGAIFNAIEFPVLSAINRE